MVEIDGDSHYGAEGIAHDARRTAFLNGRNYRVLRFTNFDVLDNAEGVFDVLRGVLGEPLYDLEYHSWISQADKYLILIDIADLISRPERSAEIRARIFFAVMYLKESSIEDSRNLSDKPVMLVFTKSDILALPEVDNTKISELNYRTVNSASYDVTLFDKRAKSVLSSFDETRLMLDSNFSQVKIVFHSSYLRTPFFSEVEREIISFIVPGSDL